MKLRILLVVSILICIGVVAVLIDLGKESLEDKAYVEKTKQELIALSRDTKATKRRIADINKHLNERWTDVEGRTGVTADGYIFFYDLHESHGMDSISDIHICYLPDEKRFLISRGHWCVDLSKWEQAKNKTELVKIFQ